LKKPHLAMQCNAMQSNLQSVNWATASSWDDWGAHHPLDLPPNILIRPLVHFPWFYLSISSQSSYPFQASKWCRFSFVFGALPFYHREKKKQKHYIMALPMWDSFFLQMSQPCSLFFAMRCLWLDYSNKPQKGKLN
jgi:hypothetical protein